MVDNKRAAIGKKSISAFVVSIPASANYDIWVFGVVVYEAVAGHPLSAYACRGKRAMISAEVGKIGLWDEYNLKKALKYIDDADENAKSLIKNLLHFDPEQRMSSMRKVLEHPFFASASSKSASEISLPEVNVVKNHVNSAPSSTKSTKERKSVSSSIPLFLKFNPSQNLNREQRKILLQRLPPPNRFHHQFLQALRIKAL